MGMYTEIYVNVDLIKDLPEEIFNTLKALCEYDYESMYFQDKPPHFPFLFSNGSVYTPNSSCSSLTFDKDLKYWSLLGKGDIKNYNNDIDFFFEWINPYVDLEKGMFIGYSRYEEDSKPTLYFKK